MKKCVVLLSGGLDSSTTLAVAKSESFQIYALSFRYGQNHQVELEAAGKVATQFGVVEHRVIDIDLAQLGGSALTDANIAVPKGREIEEMTGDIPVTYVPARNTIFLSYALAWVEVLGAGDIFIGVNALDYSGYPDCRPEFISAFQTMANLATKIGTRNQDAITVHAPLINMTKKEIIELGLSLGVDYGLTSTCYDPDGQGRACGQCDACILRLRGFQENGMSDPALYAKG